MPPAFFARDATDVAPDLLGTVLRVAGWDAVITEVEAYTSDDPASHSFRGRTPRNAPMFGPPGSLYVYFIYGMHHCVNIVTGADGDGQAVLVRAVFVEGIDPRRTTGPGRVCRELGIDRNHNGDAAIVHRGTPPASFEVTARVGISQAVDWPRRWIAQSR